MSFSDALNFNELGFSGRGGRGSSVSPPIRVVVGMWSIQLFRRSQTLPLFVGVFLRFGGAGREVIERSIRLCVRSSMSSVGSSGRVGVSHMVWVLFVLLPRWEASSQLGQRRCVHEAIASPRRDGGQPLGVVQLSLSLSR